jgi:hypothetical protein
MSIRRTIALLMFTLAVSCNAATIDFSHQIVPILREHCAECHTGDKKKGGLSMNDRTILMEGGENGAVVAVGRSAQSPLIKAITSTDPEVQMPPKGKRMPPAQVALIKQWIDDGLAWDTGFAFKKPAYEPPLKPRNPALPAARAGRSHPVDRIIDSYLAQRNKQQPPPLDDEAFLRRVHLDLIGLLPEPETRAKFLTDRAPDKRAHLVAALLANDEAYAEHWLTFWNDLLRNDYAGTGFITGGRKQISKWLYEALVVNKPFDQFARELIAPPSDDSSGFINGIKWRGEVSAGQTVEIQFAQSVSQSFLGINMKCASCHDSFIDRWKLDEAYGLAAIYSTHPLDIARCDKPTGKQASPAWLFPELGQVDPSAPPAERLKQLATLMTHPQNGRFPRTLVNRLWHRLMGHGIVHPVDAMQTEPWSSDLLDHLATYFVENGYDLRKTLAYIIASQAYQSKTQVMGKDTDAHGYTYAGPRAKRLTAEQFVDAVWTLTNAAPSKMDAPVLRGKLDSESAKLITLKAQWIWGDSAAGTAVPPSGETLQFRKIIHLAGPISRAGAVITCDNEYTLFINNRQVGKDTNWQTIEAVALHDLLKPGANTITVIAKNAGSGPNAAGLYFEARLKKADGTEEIIGTDATWQWSKNVPALKEGRLGALQNEDWKPVTVVTALPAWDRVLQSEAPALLARSTLTEQSMIRASLMKSDFLMRTLGRPNRDQIVSTRPNELTTLEAIDLANGQTFATALAKGAKQITAQNWPDSKGFITHLYRHALSRDPSAAELATTSAALGDKLDEQSIQDLLWALCMMPEFLMVR